MENENAWADNQYENLKKNTGTVCIKKKQVYIYSPSALSRRRKFRDSSTVDPDTSGCYPDQLKFE